VLDLGGAPPPSEPVLRDRARFERRETGRSSNVQSSS
jgi:hypothetical protein